MGKRNSSPQIGRRAYLKSIGAATGIGSIATFASNSASADRKIISEYAQDDLSWTRTDSHGSTHLYSASADEYWGVTTSLNYYGGETTTDYGTSQWEFKFQFHGHSLVRRGEPAKTGEKVDRIGHTDLHISEDGDNGALWTSGDSKYMGATPGYTGGDSIDFSWDTFRAIGEATVTELSEKFNYVATASDIYNSMINESSSTNKMSEAINIQWDFADGYADGLQSDADHWIYFKYTLPFNSMGTLITSSRMASDGYGVQEEISYVIDCDSPYRWDTTASTSGTFTKSTESSASSPQPPNEPWAKGIEQLPAKAKKKFRVKYVTKEVAKKLGFNTNTLKHAKGRTNIYPIMTRPPVSVSIK